MSLSLSWSGRSRSYHSTPSAFVVKRSYMILYSWCWYTIYNTPLTALAVLPCSLVSSFPFIVRRHKKNLSPTTSSLVKSFVPRSHLIDPTTALIKKKAIRTDDDDDDDETHLFLFVRSSTMLLDDDVGSCSNNNTSTPTTAITMVICRSGRRGSYEFYE